MQYHFQIISGLTLLREDLVINFTFIAIDKVNNSFGLLTFRESGRD